MGKYDDSVGGLLQVGGIKIGTPYVLYANDSGSAGTITLSDNINNYDYVDIYYNKSYGTEKMYGSVSVYKANGKPIQLPIIMLAGTSYVQVQTKEIKINGNTISNIDYLGVNMGTNSVATFKSNEIVIYRVIGYK